MPAPCLEKHQLAGFDDRARGFNRVIEVRQAEESFCAILHYESRLVTGQNRESEQAALLTLIEQLHAAGFTQLRSQLSFRGTDYFGSREPWVEYPDPAISPAKNLFSRWFGWLQR